MSYLKTKFKRMKVIQFKNKDLPNELNELFNLKTKIYQTNWMSYSI